MQSMRNKYARHILVVMGKKDLNQKKEESGNGKGSKIEFALVPVN